MRRARSWSCATSGPAVKRPFFAALLVAGLVTVLVMTLNAFRDGREAAEARRAAHLVEMRAAAAVQLARLAPAEIDYRTIELSEDGRSPVLVDVAIRVADRPDPVTVERLTLAAWPEAGVSPMRIAVAARGVVLPADWLGPVGRVFARLEAPVLTGDLDLDVTFDPVRRRLSVQSLTATVPGLGRLSAAVTVDQVPPPQADPALWGQALIRRGYLLDAAGSFADGGMLARIGAGLAETAPLPDGPDDDPASDGLVAVQGALAALADDAFGPVSRRAWSDLAVALAAGRPVTWALAPARAVPFNDIGLVLASAPAELPRVIGLTIAEK